MKKYLAFEKILATIDAERPDWIDELTELEREAEVCMQGNRQFLKIQIKRTFGENLFAVALFIVFMLIENQCANHRQYVS